MLHNVHVIPTKAINNYIEYKYIQINTFSITYPE